MSSFRLGAADLALSWKPFLHPSILALEFPPVPKVNCSQCWMADLGMLHPKIKCCSQFPSLPNFLMGELLTDSPDTEGAQRVRGWLEERRGGPLQMHTPPHIAAQYERLYEDLNDKPGCRYLDENGFCTVYEQRPPLCLGYHCLYPPNNVHIMSFWNTLATLLQMHISVATPFLVEELGFDLKAFQTFWQSTSLEDLWDGDSIKESHAKTLWQGRYTPEEFYKACYQYLKSHSDSLRCSVIEYRKEQLILFLKNLDTLTPEREQEIRQQPNEPSPQEPPPEALKLLQRQNLLYFEENIFTVYELESYLLWFHKQAHQPKDQSAATS